MPEKVVIWPWTQNIQNANILLLSLFYEILNSITIIDDMEIRYFFLKNNIVQIAKSFQKKMQSGWYISSFSLF